MGILRFLVWVLMVKTHSVPTLSCLCIFIQDICSCIIVYINQFNIFTEIKKKIPILLMCFKYFNSCLRHFILCCNFLCE